MDAVRYWVALISMILAVIGAINWGLVGLMEFDLVAAIFGGQDQPASRVVYVLVGLAGLLLLLFSPIWSYTPRSSRSRPMGI